jgi:hypothetical protein
MNRNVEGIDKVKVVLNPLFIDNSRLRKRHIDPHNRLTLHREGSLFALSIHAEYFNPLADFYLNVASALYELIKEKIILFPDNPYTPLFIYNNISWFVLYIQEIEFYFDFKTKNIAIDDEACMESDTGLHRYNGTYYTYL